MEAYYVELTGINESRLSKEEISEDNLKDNEAIIKAEYSMISAGTELSRAFGLKKGFSYPVRPGYCMVGRVLKKGDGLDVEVGDRVFVNAPHASIVRRSHENKIQGPLIFKIPDDINPVEASTLNLLLVAIQGINLSQIKLGDTVGVFGLGNIGILVAAIYKKMGCKVIGIDPVSSRCNLAKKMSIEHVIASENPKKEIDKLTNNKGLDIAIDVTGLSNVIMDCIFNTKAYGQVILLGSPRQSYTCDITPVLSDIHMKNLIVKGAFNKTTPVYPVDGSNNSLINNLDKAITLLRDESFDISVLISDVIDPKDCQKAYYDLMYNKDKFNLLVYDWNKY